MRSIKLLLLSLIFFVLLTLDGYSQIDEDDEFERMLLEEVEVENPVYKPVVALGIGSFNFMGDVNDFYTNYMGTQPGFKVNISTFIDNQRYYRLNFFLLYGNLSGNERSYLDLERNLNFESEIINFGMNFEYTFNHILPADRWITPFISVGAESFRFNSKADLYDARGRRYNYWSDGTIRDMPENSPESHESVVIQRDYKYETDLRSANLYGMGDYPQLSFAVPFDYGIDFKISERVNMRVGSSIHFTFTNLIDNLGAGSSGITGSNKNDRFSYSYVTFHLDLFSDPTTIVVERMFADVDFDYALIEDNDGDGIFDFWDKCPDTPAGVEVGEFGCPIDSDGDGVPDYLDSEPNTRPGAFTDENGEEITSDHLTQLLGQSDEAIYRNEIDIPLTGSANIYPEYGRANYDGIPDKFIFLDRDKDGFISFEELIRAVDVFFDGAQGLAVEDIYELNDFFFSQ